MFKTSVITDEIGQDFETACALAGEFNLNAVEIRSVYERGPFEFTEDDILRMKKILKDKGLKHCIAVADKLRTNLIRGFTFWAKQPLEPAAGSPASGPAAFDPETIASRFEEAVKILEHAGHILVLESDPISNL